MRRSVVLLVILLGLLPACSGLDYSKNYWGAGSFHPRKIVVLPVSVGGHETAQEVVEDVVVKGLWGTGWYEQMITPQQVKTRAAESPDFSKLLSEYVVKLHTLGESDTQLAQKIGQAYNTAALLQVDLSSWGYGLVEGDKMAWLSLKMTLIDAQSGDIMWKARHRIMEDYLLVQPVLRDLCEELVSLMLSEMPH